jgi:hypothetical protein
MQGFSGLLRLATVAFEAFLSVAATALSGFSLFSGYRLTWDMMTFFVSG